MVQNIATNAGRAGGIEVDRGDDRAIVRNEEVAVHRDKSTNHNFRWNTEANTKREEGSHRRPLAVDQYRQGKEQDGKEPRCLFNQKFDLIFQIGHMGVHQRVAKPGDTENSDNRAHPGMEDGTTGNGSAVRLAEHNDERSGGEHDDFDDVRHIKQLHIAFGIRERRTQVRHQFCWQIFRQFIE